jgi:hypothetical protein
VPVEAGGEAPVQASPGHSGLPDTIRTGIESLSGVDLGDVSVHLNSPRPARLGALAYTQGTDIHVAPGQEQHLPHEAWHAVQQLEGRVRPTTRLKGGVPLNDDSSLEHEADAVGSKATQAPTQRARAARPVLSAPRSTASAVVQREDGDGDDDGAAELTGMLASARASKPGSKYLSNLHTFHTHAQRLASSQGDAAAKRKIVAHLKTLVSVASDDVPNATLLEEQAFERAGIGAQNDPEVRSEANQRYSASLHSVRRHVRTGRSAEKNLKAQIDRLTIADSEKKRLTFLLESAMNSHFATHERDVAAHKKGSGVATGELKEVIEPTKADRAKKKAAGTTPTLKKKTTKDPYEAARKGGWVY